MKIWGNPLVQRDKEDTIPDPHQDKEAIRKFLDNTGVVDPTPLPQK